MRTVRPNGHRAYPTCYSLWYGGHLLPCRPTIPAAVDGILAHSTRHVHGIGIVRVKDDSIRYDPESCEGWIAQHPRERFSAIRRSAHTIVGKATDKQH